MTISGVLLAHGAGGNRDHRLFIALEEAFGADGIPVRRFDFPYRKKAGAKRRPPDRQPVLVDAIRAEIDAWVTEAGVDAERLVLGGRSMGGRMCSIAQAEGLAAAGLVLLSYPLHPPGKPEKLRVEHFASISAPCLFVSGERDPFGSPEEFSAETDAITAPVTMRWLAPPGAGHDPSPAHDDEIIAATREWVRDLQD